MALSRPRAGAQQEKGQPFRRWCFTITKYRAAELTALRANLTEQLCRYAIVGLEQGRRRGMAHIQGYVSFRRPLRSSRVKALLGGRAHIERASREDSVCAEHCRKQREVCLEIGEVQHRGTRNDLRQAARMLWEMSGDLVAVARALPTTFIRHGHGLRDYCNTLQLAKERDFKTAVDVVVGPTGSGKSRYAHQECAHKEAYWKVRGRWWDGYVNQEIGVLDDFSGWLPFFDLYRIGDRYPYKVEIKGGFVEFLAKRVIITSNRDPELWYKDENLDLRALFGCFTTLKRMENGELTDVDPPFPING